MMIIIGKVNKLELNENGDQSLAIKIGSQENMMYAYAYIYFKGKAPFELGDEVEVVFRKKDSEAGKIVPVNADTLKEIINSQTTAREYK